MDKIKISNNNDNVIGIVSGNPAFVGDSHEFGWKNGPKRDNFNRAISFSL